MIRTAIVKPGSVALVLAAAAAVGALCASALAIAPAPAAAASAGLPTIAYAQDPPPPGRTGGFGETTCRECHYGSPLNAAGGSLSLEISPAGGSEGGDDEAGSGKYRVRLLLRRAEMERAGFQLAARVARGPEAGEQAGRLRSTGKGVAVTADPGSGIQYAHHTDEGTSLREPGVACWEFEWVPSTGADGTRTTVLFHAAANAANHDDSVFGDFVYTAVKTFRRR